MKYMGSKSRIAKDIYNVIESDLLNSNTYVEPFCGGMNMISYISSRFHGNIIANDFNEYLIEMWKALLSGWIPPQYVSKDEYYEIKSTIGSCDENKSLIGWVGFNCSYSGKWFDGYSGVVNTKTGKIRNYQDEAIKNINSQLEMIGDNIKVVNQSYDEMYIPDGSVVYCDPPYANTRRYKNKFNSNKFWDWVRLLSERCIVYVSEYNAPDDFECVWSKQLKSSLSANHQSGTTTTSVEKLFKYKGNKI